MRLSRILALTLAVGALAGAVQAQTPTPMTIKDGNGAAQALCEYKPDGTNLAGCTVRFNWTGSAWVLEPADSLGRPYVNVFSLPNVTLGTGSNTIGSIANTSFGAAQSGTWNVGLSAGGNVIGQVGSAQGSATAGQSGPLVQGAVTTGSPAYTSGQTSPLSLDPSGNLRVNVVAGGGSGGTSSNFGSSFPAIGTAIGAKNGANMVNLAADGSNNLLVNCAAGCSASSSTYGAALPAGGQAVGVNVVSSAPTYAAGNLQAPTMDTSGSLRVDLTTALPTGANSIGGVTQAAGSVAVGAYPVGALGDLGSGGQLHTDLQTIDNDIKAPPPLGTSGGWTPKLLNALPATATTVKGSAGQLSTLQCFNPNASQIYVQVFNAASPTVGTTTPALSIPIAATATGGLALSGVGIQFSTAIVVAATTTATGSTAPSTAPDCNAIYN